MAAERLSDVRAQFREGGAGDIFVMRHVPVSERRGIVLMVPPFAEEMNRSRKMFSLQARHLASLGLEVVLPDLYGTGDSHGKFADARWETWRRDLTAALSAVNLDDKVPITVLALRLGALLAVDSLRTDQMAADRLVFWSPCTDGRRFLDQFLRLRTMAAMLTKSGERESVGDLRQRLQEDGMLEVAGYELSAELAAAIDELNLTAIAPESMPPTYWFEVVTSDNSSFPPGSAKVVDELQSDQRTIDARLSVGPQFWSTPETTIATGLVDATQSLLATT